MSVSERGTFTCRTIQVDGFEHRYVVWTPPGFNASRAWPLVLFLHGSGEMGKDGVRHLGQGLPRRLAEDAECWPVVMVIPQLSPKTPPRERPTPGQPGGPGPRWRDAFPALDAMLDRTMAEMPIDRSRLYLTGLSRGGNGAWEYAAANPDRWAAVAPVCGYGDAAALGPKLVGVPVWAFHGDADDVVPVQRTTAIIDAIRAAGGDPRVTIYPGVNHGSWEPAYADPKLARWMLAQRRAISE